VLSKEDNALLTQVGPGTPMGELLRRYWMPIAAVEELEETPTKQVRLMGEDLALYKDKGGTYGLIDLHCPHRRADLSYGMVEDCGLRCNYHGWAFNERGDCIDQPFEDVAHPEAHFKERIKIKAYPARAKAGLIWAYLGPQPVPELWDWDIYHERGFKQIVFSEIPCNWLQCAENDIDPVHVEWLHGNWSIRLKGKDGPYTPGHLRVGFDEFEYGYVYRRIRNDTGEWTQGQICLWPNCLLPGNHFEWRVPIDDANTLSVGWFMDRIPGTRPFEQERIPYWWSPIKDEKTGRWVSSHVMNQDFIAWVGQGTVSDRWNEHLGASDEGVIELRRRLLADIKVVEDGGDPKGILRDPAKNDKIYLPRSARARTGFGAPQQEPTPFQFLAGQPPAITDEMKRIWVDHAEKPATVTA
jgi:5,5'-dehydrodivanillate O-demethylase